jgi:hypothetical protein
LFRESVKKLTAKGTTDEEVSSLIVSKAYFRLALLGVNLILGSAALSEEELHATAATLSAPSLQPSVQKKNPTGFVFEKPRLDVPIILKPHLGRVETGLEQSQPLQQFSGSQIVTPGVSNYRSGSNFGTATGSAAAPTNLQINAKSASINRFDQMLQGNTQLILDNSAQNYGSGTSLARVLPLTMGQTDFGKYWEGSLVVQSYRYVAEPAGPLIPYDIAAESELFPPGLTGQFWVKFDSFRDKLTINPPLTYFERPSGERSLWVFDATLDRMKDLVDHWVVSSLLKNDVEQVAPNVVQQHLLSRDTHSCPGYSDQCFCETMFRYTRTGDVLYVDIIALTFDDHRKLVGREVSHGQLRAGESRPWDFYSNPTPYFSGNGTHRFRPNSPGNITRIEKIGV